MRILLFGYGKMGRLVEQMAAGRGHTVIARIDTPSDPVPWQQADVAIDFSSPEAAFENIRRCLEAGIPVVSGTTGWLEKYSEACQLCEQKGGAFLYASNFSLGVNLFFELNAHLARMMREAPGYQADIEEIHHTQKLDAPSGTAITLAEGLVANSDYTSWESEVDQIEIIHTAHNRQGFAQGAVVAAEWIVGKSGIFGMKDVLNLR